MIQTINEAGMTGGGGGHPRWIRLVHWIAALSVLTLAFSGIVILMAHPRLYWGATGNDLTPALIELPISRNYHHAGWKPSEPFFEGRSTPATAVRSYEIFNQNGWGRSLHFLAAWFLLAIGALYWIASIAGGHLRRDLVPRPREFADRGLRRDVTEHLRMRAQPGTAGPPYGLTQKLAYFGVAFLALPMMLVTGLGMSPAFNAAYPWLSGMFGGSQSARTLHFCFFASIVLFILVHVLMVVRTGFKAQMRGITLGK